MAGAIERACWLLLAAIHALPALALVRPSLIERLYGVGPGGGGADVHLLLHHRAALFAAIVAACAWAAFQPGARGLAALVTGISMIGFLALWLLAGMPASLRQIAIADLIGLPGLIYVAVRAAA